MFIQIVRILKNRAVLKMLWWLLLQLNAGATQVTDAADGAADGTATVVATCNAAGTAWEVNGMAITNVECTIRTLSLNHSSTYRISISNVTIYLSCLQHAKYALRIWLHWRLLSVVSFQQRQQQSTGRALVQLGKFNARERWIPVLMYVHCDFWKREDIGHIEI